MVIHMVILATEAEVGHVQPDSILTHSNILKG